MKRIISFVILFFSLLGFGFAQTVVFWTDNVDALPIKVYMNGRYIGSITKAYRNSPNCYTSGCVTIKPPYSSNTWRAESESLGAETSGRYSLVNGCNSFQLFAGGRKLSQNPYSNNNQTSSNNANTSTTLTDPGPSAAGAVGALLLIADVLLNSDMYISAIGSDYYSGLEFGLRNNWNSHICFEQTAAWRYSLEKPLFPPFHTDTYGENPFWGDYNYRKRSNWGCNFRMLYNFFDRDRVFGRDKPFMINPYIGFGCDYMQYDGFFTSGVVGFTFGSRRVKMDCRYSFGYDFRYQRVPVNQLQIGLIVAYQYYKFGIFRKH